MGACMAGACGTAALLLAGTLTSPAVAQRSSVQLAADIAFPANNGGASIGGKSVGWSRAVILTAQEAKRIENYRCVFDLAYHVSNLGATPTGTFSDRVRPLAADASAGTGAPEPAVEQSGLSLGPRETRAVRTELSLAPGAWFVLVKGDAGGQVKELDETGNNEGRFRVMLVGTCDGTHWGMTGTDYRAYLLEHLIAKNLRIAGHPTGTGLTLDAAKLAPGGSGACLVPLEYQVENHGGLATQPFTSVAQLGTMPHPSVQDIPVAALAPGATATVHAQVILPEGTTPLTIHAVVVTSGTGGQEYGTSTVPATVTLAGSCQRR